jgi:hypothetical protein
MKTIVTAVVVLATFSGMAQDNLHLPLPKYYKENKQNSLSTIKPNFQKPQNLKEYKPYDLNTIKPYIHKKLPFLFSLPDSTKDYEVVTLKQDGMPCIAPNMQKFNTMPNAAKPADLSTLYNKPGAIPNPLLGQQKPKTKPFIKPDSSKEGS